MFTPFLFIVEDDKSTRLAKVNGKNLYRIKLIYRGVERI